MAESTEEDAGRTIPRHVLLLEFYPDLCDLLTALLVDGGCRVDVASNGREMKDALALRRYDCVLLNIDQKHEIDFGLDLASTASAMGSRIIMIPDYKTDRAAIAAKGWLQLTKPFTVASARAVLTQALGPAGNEDAIIRRAAEVLRERDRARKKIGLVNQRSDAHW